MANVSPDSPDSAVANRATVAQTLAEVRGLRDLFIAEVGNLKDRFDTVAGLPVLVAELKAQNSNQESRIAAVEKELEKRQEEAAARDESDRTWRRTHLPIIVLTLVIAIGAIVGIVTQLH